VTVARRPLLVPLLAAALAAAPVLAGEGSPPAPAPAPAPAGAGAEAGAAGATAAPAWTPRTHGKGRLEVLPSGLAVLHLAGTPEEMGEQHGTLLGAEVRTLVRDYLPRVVRGTREDALAKARALEPRIPERHLREMKALARAAGVHYDDVLLGSVVVELFGLHGCSSAAAFGPATADGSTVVGRNLEWPDHRILGARAVVVAARPEGMRPFLSVGFPALAGVVTGMNGEGVFTAELVVLNAPRADREAALAGVPWPVLQRRVLEECGSLAEAAALVRASPRTVPQNLLLADPAGALVLECGAGRCVERAPVAGVVAVTNFWDEAGRPRKDDLRYAGICADLAAVAGGKVDADSMERAMRKASSHPLAAALNLQCVVFEPARLRARVAAGPPPASRRAMEPIDAAALLGVTAPADRAPAPAGGE
jgi:hypothetical protein